MSLLKQLNTNLDLVQSDTSQTRESYITISMLTCCYKLIDLETAHRVTNYKQINNSFKMNLHLTPPNHNLKIKTYVTH